MVVASADAPRGAAGEGEQNSAYRLAATLLNLQEGIPGETTGPAVKSVSGWAARYNRDNTRGKGFAVAGWSRPAALPTLRPLKGHRAEAPCGLARRQSERRRRRPFANTSPNRRSSCRSTPCRAPNFRRSTSTDISRRPHRRPQSRAGHAMDALNLRLVVTASPARIWRDAGAPGVDTVRRLATAWSMFAQHQLQRKSGPAWPDARHSSSKRT